MQKKKTIYVTKSDLNRLEKLLELLEEQADARDQEHLLQLEEELHRAKVVAPQDIHPEVVTMNSKVRTKDLSTGKETIYHLVFPGDADAGNHKVSILAPIGTALIGFKAGDVVEWKAPAGVKQLKIEEVLYQPEAAGDFHL